MLSWKVLCHWHRKGTSREIMSGCRVRIICFSTSATQPTPSVLRISTKTCTLTTVTHRKGVEGGRVGVTHRNRDFTSDRSDAQKQILLQIGEMHRNEILLLIGAMHRNRFYFRQE